MSLQSATMPFPAQLKTPLQIDPVLFTITATLLLSGLVILASASISISDSISGDPFYYVKRQLMAAALGICGAFICILLPVRVWRNLGPLLLLVGFALLIVVLIPGVGYTVNGSTRWLRIGVMNLQVSEPARLCIILYIAGYLVRHNKSLRASFAGFLRPMFLLVGASALLLAEPDFGAAIVLLATALAMLFVAGARLRDFFLFFGVGVFTMVALAISSPYRLNRVTGFLDPWSDPFNSGFQLTQSLIAVGRGDWFGVGLGDSVQKLFYLPEAHTDFVFAVLAEELGFVGVTVTVLLFGVIVYRAIRLGPRAAALGMPFHGLVSTGLALTIGLQAFINMGVNIGLLPTKGITLPLISYGRTSAVITLITLGLLLRIQHEVQRAAIRDEARQQRKKKR